MEYIRTIRANDKAKKKSKIALIKNVQDSRYDETGMHVCTHNGQMKLKADFNVADLSEIPNLSSFDFIFIDEAHFFSDVVDVVSWLVLNTKMQIYLTGLNATSGDDNGDRITFGCVTQLLPYTSRFKIIPAICFRCGNETLFTETTAFGKHQHKKGKFVGSFEMYSALCAECIVQNMKHRQVLTSILAIRDE